MIIYSMAVVFHEKFLVSFTSFSVLRSNTFVGSLWWCAVVQSLRNSMWFPMCVIVFV